MHNTYDYLFKIILIGDSGVGKTCLMKRYTENVFCENLAATIGVDFKIKTITLGSKKAKLQLWDTAGQERFKSIVSNYYRGADGVFVVFDMCNKESFKHIELWIEEFLMRNSKESSEIFLLGNKMDKIEDITITDEEVHKFCREHGIKKDNFIKVSAKTDLLVEDAFLIMTKNMISRFGDKKINRVKKSALNSNITRGGCC